MKNLFFLNYGFKIVGAIALIILLMVNVYMLSSGSSVVFGIFVPDKLMMLLTLLSFLLVIFSKEKNESARISEIRQQSLFLALFLNLICSMILIACLSTIDGLWVYYGSLYSIYLFYLVIFYIRKAAVGKS